MIVQVIQIKSVRVGKTKYHAPVGANGDGVEAFQAAFEGVKPKAWNIHILDGLRGIEPSQNVTQLLDVLGHYAPRIVVLIEPLQSLVAYGTEHLKP